MDPIHQFAITNIVTFGKIGGYEIALTNLAAAVALGFVGAGAYGLDALIGFALPEPIAAGVGLLIAVVGAIVAFAGRRTVAQLEPAQQTH